MLDIAYLFVWLLGNEHFNFKLVYCR